MNVEKKRVEFIEVRFDGTARDLYASLAEVPSGAIVTELVDEVPRSLTEKPSWMLRLSREVSE